MDSQAQNLELLRSPRFSQHQRKFASVYQLREGARRRLPHFAYEYGDGGAGNDIGIQSNWAALDAIKLMPRYGVMQDTPALTCSLFAATYAAPLGIAPMGSPIIVWPGADRILAAAAQRARIPYVLGIVGGATIEEITRIAPDVTWLQMYRFARNDHAIGFDILRRAESAGVRALVLTLDVPVRSVRPRESTVGLGGSGAFRPDWRMALGMFNCPSWAAALLANGIPKFASIQPYAGSSASLNQTIKFALQEMGGTFSWEEVKKYRDRWKGPLIVKGILHPQDAEIALANGVDGIFVSNHGGRQLDALPAAIDCLPPIVRAVNGRAKVLFDSGIRSGSDAARALALGADAVFAGKAFLWGLGSLGADGPGHVIDLLADELRSTLGQIGIQSVDQIRKAVVIRPNVPDHMNAL